MKEGIVRYVNIMRRIFLVFAIAMIVLIMVSLVFAVQGYLGFIILAPVEIVIFLIVYAVYAMRVTLSVVIGVQTTDRLVYVQTKRKTYTYDVRCGCVAVRVKKNKFIGTFRTQDSQDTFVFYRKVLFSRSYEEQFTPEDIRRFYPALGEE